MNKIARQRLKVTLDITVNQALLIIINKPTFATFGEANNICNAESQTNSNNKEMISLQPYEREYSKHKPSNCLKN